MSICHRGGYEGSALPTICHSLTPVEALAQARRHQVKSGGYTKVEGFSIKENC